MNVSFWVVLVPVLIWLGVFGYLVFLDRRVAALERATHKEEP